MKTEFSIPARLGTEIRPGDTAGLKPGDRLRGLVLDVGPDGRARIDFGAFRATADLPLRVQAGDRLQVSVAQVGNPLYLRIESSGLPATAPPPPGDPLVFPDPAVLHVIGRTAAPGDPSQPGSDRFYTLLARLRSRLIPIALGEGAEPLTSRLADLVENSGLLLEKRLETALRHLLTDLNPPDLKALGRHPWIHALLGTDTKSLALQLGALTAADPAAASPASTALAQPLARLLADILAQQVAAVRHLGSPPTYGAASRSEVPTAARIGRWTADFVVRARLCAPRLGPQGEHALGRMAAAAEHIEMLAPAGRLDPSPIRRILAHTRVLLAAPGVASAEGQTALALIGQLHPALADMEAIGTGPSRVALLVSRLAESLDLCQTEALRAVAARLRPLAALLVVHAPSDNPPATLAAQVLRPALADLKACLYAADPPTRNEVLADLDRLENRLDRYLSDPSRGGSDHGDSGRNPAQVLTFTLPLAESRNSARIKIHLKERRRRGQPGEHHIALLLSFANLGPVRADLHFRPPDLAIRFAVTEERTRIRLQSAGPTLAAALKPHFGRLDVTAVVSVESVARFEFREPEPDPGHAVDLTV